MPTRTPNSSSNILAICVHETIRVVDVFGFVARKIKGMVQKFLSEFTEIIGKAISMKIVFANLNNHSSPPFGNGWTASKIGDMRLCMIKDRVQSYFYLI